MFFLLYIIQKAVAERVMVVRKLPNKGGGGHGTSEY